MSVAEKWLGWLAGIALATTLVLPGRQTPAVVGAVTQLVDKPLATAMGNFTS